MPAAVAPKALARRLGKQRQQFVQRESSSRISVEHPSRDEKLAIGRPGLASFTADQHSVGDLYLEARRKPDLDPGLGEQRAVRDQHPFVQRVDEIPAGRLAKPVRFDVRSVLRFGYVEDPN